jgi:hypothetical protein
MYNLRFVLINNFVFVDHFIYFIYSTRDFDELMKCLSSNGKSMISLIFNIQMINEQKRFIKFYQMLSHCSNLINLRY